LDGTLPPGFTVPDPMSVAALMPDELPLEAGDDEEEETDEEEDDTSDEEGVEAISDSDLPESGEGDKPDEPGT
jgi:segregation and condensation protein B